MNFSETIATLYEETEFCNLYAMVSYGDGTIGVGFRASHANLQHNDPIIDGNAFMICASAWSISEKRWIESTTELWHTPKEDIEIRLRADYAWPLVTIDLGEFKVIEMKIEEEKEMIFLSGPRWIPTRIKLRIKRK